MAVTKDDQNTFIMIAGVLVICVIALIAVLGSIWQIIREPVNQTISGIGYLVKLQTLDYNFSVPITTAVVPTPQPTPAPTPTPPTVPPSDITSGNVDIEYDYNFAIPTGSGVPVGNNSNIQDALFSDAKLLELEGQGQPVTQGNLKIAIPKIKVESPIVQGLNGDALLKEGFWVAPSDRKLGSAEIIFLCHRRYFGPTDPKSCWFLNELVQNDLITITVENVNLTYKIVGTNIFKADDPLIYKASETEDLIRIVTTDPLHSNENRLVVLAERVK
jgi:LPXTG-site transpeptidase (sortase) family protein